MQSVEWPFKNIFGRFYFYILNYTYRLVTSGSQTGPQRPPVGVFDHAVGAESKSGQLQEQDCKAPDIFIPA